MTTKNKPDEAPTDCGAPDEAAREKERKYAQEYYLTHKKDRSAATRKRWREDEEYRNRELERARAERAAVRASKAQTKFSEMVAEKQAAEAAKATTRKRPARRPRAISLTGRAADLIEVYTSGVFAHAIGREGETIRDWLGSGVLPGATVFYGEGIGRKAYFTEGFIQAVYRACERLYFADGNGRLGVLRGLIAEELAKAGESYIPLGGAERVWPKLPKEKD